MCRDHDLQGDAYALGKRLQEFVLETYQFAAPQVVGTRPVECQHPQAAGGLDGREVAMGRRVGAAQESFLQEGVERREQFRVPAPDGPCQVTRVGQHGQPFDPVACGDHRPSGDGIHDRRVVAAGLQALQHLVWVGAGREFDDGRIGQVPRDGVDVRRPGRYSEGTR